METLRNYLATLSQEEKVEYALRCGTTLGYLRKALSVRPDFDGALVKKLWQQSRGAVIRSDLRPDIWDDDQPVTKSKAA